MSDPRRLDVAAACCAVTLCAVAAAIPIALLAAIAGISALAVWRRPYWALEIGAFLVLAVRPSLDVFSERRFGLGPFASNPSVVSGLVVFSLGALLLLRRSMDGRRLWPDRSLWHIHALLFAAYSLEFVSGARLYGGQGIGEGARELIRVLSIVAAFLIVWWWASEGAYKRGWVYVVLGAAIPIVVSLWQLATGRGFSDIVGVYRIQGTFSHPNAFSQYLIPFVLVAVAGVGARRGMQKVLLGGVALGLTALIALSYTRTAILGLVVGLVALPILQRWDMGIAGLMRGVGVVAVFAVIGWLLFGSEVKSRFDTLAVGREALQAAETGESENSLEWRLVNWGILITLGMEHPIAGHGAGMTTVLNPLISADNGVPFNAHDDFVRFFFEGGLVGLALYALYALLLCRWAVRRARRVDRRHAPTAFGVAAAFLTLFLLTAGTTELSLQTADLYQLYGMLALVAALPASDFVGRMEPTSDEVSLPGAGGASGDRG